MVVWGAGVRLSVGEIQTGVWAVKQVSGQGVRVGRQKKEGPPHGHPSFCQTKTRLLAFAFFAALAFFLAAFAVFFALGAFFATFFGALLVAAAFAFGAFAFAFATVFNALAFAVLQAAALATGLAALAFGAVAFAFATVFGAFAFAVLAAGVGHFASNTIVVVIASFAYNFHAFTFFGGYGFGRVLASYESHNRKRT